MRTYGLDTKTNKWTLLTEKPFSGDRLFEQKWDLSQGEVVIVDAGYIWLATLAQTLRLNTNESPFYSDYGIPAHTSVMTQIAPNVAILNIQQKFSQYFQSLSIYLQANAVQPTYNITAVFLNGTTIQTVVAT